MTLTVNEEQALIWQVATLYLDAIVEPGVGHPNSGLINGLHANRAAAEDRAAYLATDRRDSDAQIRGMLRTLTGAPAPTTVRVIVLGDSITAGHNSADHTGYTGWLVDYLDRTRNVTAVVDRTGAVDGTGLTALAPLVPGILAANPTARLVLLMVGTNDANSGDVATWQTRYGNLVDQILASDPGMKVACARVVISDPTGPQAYANPGLIAAETTLNTWVDNVVAARLAGGRVVKVDMTTIPATWLTDGGWHPGDAAYARMARLWADAIAPWLP